MLSVSKWKILDTVDEVVNSETRALLEYWVFMVKVLMSYRIFLSGFV